MTRRIVYRKQWEAVLCLVISSAIIHLPTSWAQKVVYTGQVVTPSRVTISVALTLLQPPELGKKCAVLKYGGNRGCACQGIYEGETKMVKVFSLISQEGRMFCDKLSLLEIVQATDGSDDIVYTVYTKSHTVTEKGHLKKAKSAR